VCYPTRPNMTALCLLLVLTPLADQAVKRILVLCLPQTGISLGRVARLEILRSRVWLDRRAVGSRPALLWILWVLFGGILFAVAAVFPQMGWPAGLLLGGALSHAIETSVRGYVIDYVRLGHLPAFNLADGAIFLGGVASGLQFARIAGWGAAA